MSKEGKSPKHRLKKALPVSIESALLGPKEQLIASVSKVSEDSVELQLSKPGSQSALKRGERVRLKYWDEEAVYFSDVEVIAVTGPRNEHVTTSLPSEPVALQRREFFRARSPVSFSFSVVQAANSRLVSGEVYPSESLNISAGGLRFESTLTLKAGDEIELRIAVSPSEQLSILARVVTSQRVEHQGKYSNSIGVEFYGLTPEERNQIGEFAAETQKKK